MAVQRNRIISTRRLIGQQQAAGSGPYGPGDYLMSRLSAGTLSVDDLGSFDNEDDQIASLENTQFLQTTGLTPTRQPATINTFNYTPPSHLTSVRSHSSESQRHRNTSHTTFATSCQVTELVSMVQEQQGLLIELIDNQKKLESEQFDLKNQLFTLEEQMNRFDSEMPASASCSNKKPRITRNHSAQVTKVYDEMTDKFNFEDSSRSQHNQKVKLSIVKQIMVVFLSRESCQRSCAEKI